MFSNKFKKMTNEAENEENKESNVKCLVSIHYPAVVQNVSKMLDTLGGIKMISTIYSEKNRRMELRWRPEDCFCKPAFASRKPVEGILLKIKYKRNKRDNINSIVSCESIGRITEEYKFSNLCDFQFIPSTKTELFYDSIVPHGLDPDWINQKAPFFLPPPAFSKIDSVQNFSFTVPSDTDDSMVIGNSRKKRYANTRHLTFDDPEVPTIPKETPSKGTPSKLVSSETMEHLKSLFQERPIYSKTAIKCISKIPEIQLKIILPYVAYYFINGPWRSLWVRFGYDPRKDPSSRIYQSLDYRVGRNIKEAIKAKRHGLGALSYKFINTTGKISTLISRGTTENKEKEEEESFNQDEYIFKPEVVPPSRQCFYQYCDIHIPEVKSMLENLEEPDETAVCRELDGWLPTGMADQTRHYMNLYVQQEIKRRSAMSQQPQNTLTAETSNAMTSESESDYSDEDQ